MSFKKFSSAQATPDKNGATSKTAPVADQPAAKPAETATDAASAPKS
jgi:hypothetical protein